MSKTTKRVTAKDGSINPQTSSSPTYITGKAKSRTVSAVKNPKKNK
jgi:hypothetical protein